MPQISGKFLKMMPKNEGEKDGKEWVRTQFVIMTMDNNPKWVAFDVFGHDKVAVVETLQPGSTVIVEYAPESREYNEKFYTNLQCLRIMVASKVEVWGGEAK